MMNRSFSLPWIGLFAATRITLGVGIGLLISRRISRDEAKAAGVALTVMGGLTTIPFIVGVIAGKRGEVSEIRPTA